MTNPSNPARQKDDIKIVDPARHLALLLQAIDDVEMEFAEAKSEFKQRLETLQNEARKVQRDILSGQKPLPLETGDAA